MNRIFWTFAVLTIGVAFLVCNPPLHADGCLLEGQIRLWPPLPEEPYKPAKSTTRVKFTLEAGLDGPTVAIPDANGMWQERFFIMDQQDHILIVEAALNLYEPNYICRKPCRVPLPQRANRRIYSDLWHIKRISQEEACEAREVVSYLKENYPCYSEGKNGNYKVWECWQDQNADELDKARSKAKEGINSFMKAEGYYKTNRIIVDRASLEISVCLFCNAAETYGRINVNENPLTIDKDYLDKVELMRSDAYLQCVRIQRAENEKIAKLKRAISHIERIASDPKLKNNRQWYARILGNWMDFLRYLSPNPNDDLVVARTLQSTMNDSWQRFRDEAAQFYNLEFKDPEHTAYIVADRITRISEKLNR